MVVISKKQEITDFSLIIENLARQKRISYMDAIILHCEITGLEIESAAKMVNSTIKSRLKTEAEDLNFLEKPKIKRLPV